MQSYRDHLNQELTDPAFKAAFEEEKRILERELHAEGRTEKTREGVTVKDRIPVRRLAEA